MQVPPSGPGSGDAPATNQRRGALAEELAGLYLQLRGWPIVARNLRGGGGEIDLLTRDGSALVFVEVRLRGAGSWSAAPASIDRRKQQRLRACARWLLHRRRELIWPGCSFRFDVIAIDLLGEGLRLSHLRGVRLEG